MALRISWRSLVDGVTTVAILVAAAAVVHSLYFKKPERRAELPIPKEPIDVTGTQSVGKKTAPIGIILITDFQCPYCGVFARDTLPSLERSHIETGRAFLVFKHLPIKRIHPLAEEAAAIFECSGEERFREVHDAFFSNQEKLNEELLLALAVQTGAQRHQIVGCLESIGRRTIKENVDWARSLGVRSTPSFLIGLRQADGRVKVTRTAQGALSAGELSAMIDAASAPTSGYWMTATMAGLAVLVAGFFIYRRSSSRRLGRRSKSVTSG